MIDNLRTLRAFVAVAETLNFRQAAERLNLSQPALTRSIATLEREIGSRLLERTTRRVALTPAGELLLREARQLLGNADALARKLRHAVASQSPRLRVGCTALSYFTLLPETLARFRATHEGVEVELQELSTEAQLASLASANLDVGFVVLPAAHPALEIRLVQSVRMQLAVPSSHPLAASDAALPLTAFAEETFIMHQRAEHPVMHDEILQCCARAQFQPKVRLRQKHGNCLGLVAASLGVHFTAASRDSLQMAGVKFLEITGPMPTLELAMAWRKDDTSPLLQIFKDCGVTDGH